MVRVTLSLTLPCTLGEAVAGLRSVDDAGDALLARLEAAADVRFEASPVLAVAPAPRPGPPGVAETAAVYAATGGSIKATARALGIARSTVRARLQRVAAPANDDAKGVRRIG